MGGRHKERTFGHLEEHFDFAEQSASRRALEASWFASLSYYYGQQALYIDERGEIRADDRPGYRANMLKVQTEIAQAKLLNTGMEFRVAANSDARDDRHAAMIADKLFRHAQSVIRWPALKLEGTKWASICGTAVYKTTWDPELGPADRLFYTEDDEPMVGAPRSGAAARAQQKARYSEIRPGDIHVEVLSPFQFYVDDKCQSPTLESADWVAHVQYMRPVDVAAMWGRKPKVASSPHIGESELFMRRLQHMIPDVHYSQLDASQPAAGGERVCVIEYWRRPQKSNNYNGRYIVAAGTDVLVDKANPYARYDIPFPFVPQHWTVAPGRFWGLGLVEQLRSIQREYNDARAHASAHQKLHSKPIIMAPAGSNLARARFTSIDGLFLTYRAAAGKPSPLEMPPLPAHVMQNAATAQQEMMAISAQSPPEASSLPGELRSGQAIALMQRSNNLVLNEPILHLAEATQEVGRHLLRLMSAFYDEPRVVKDVGSSLPLSIQSFSGADMRGNWDLRLFGQPSPLETSDAFKADVLELAQLGVLSPENPEDKAAVLKAFAFGTADELINDRVRAEALQEKQISDMLRDPSYTPVPQPFEDNAAMSRVLVRLMLSPEFDQLDDMARGRIRVLWDARKKLLQAEMQAAMQAQAMTAGTPGKSGTPSQPRRVAR